MRRSIQACALLLLTLFGSAALAQQLDILVYGATGKIGSLVVDEALARGHRVTAVSRNPAQIEKQHPNLAAIRGDLLDDDSIRELTNGRDVVIVSVRGVIGEKIAGNALQYIAVQRVAAVLRDMGQDAPRLIHVGGAGSLLVDGELYADRLPRLFLPKGLEAEIDGQVLTLEFLTGQDGIDWTYITPPKNFTNGERTGEYRTGSDEMLEDARGRSRLSRADFAVALIDEAETGAHVGRRFSVAY